MKSTHYAYHARQVTFDLISGTFDIGLDLGFNIFTMQNFYFPGIDYVESDSLELFIEESIEEASGDVVVVVEHGVSWMPPIPMDLVLGDKQLSLREILLSRNYATESKKDGGH